MAEKVDEVLSWAAKYKPSADKKTRGAGLEIENTLLLMPDRTPILVHIYLMDGVFLDAEIIKQGYGFAYTKYPFKYMEEFRRYERGQGRIREDCGGKKEL